MLTEGLSRIRDFRILAISVLLSFAFASVQLWHTRTNSALPDWDEGRYIQFSLKIFDAIGAGPRAIPEAYTGYPTKAPRCSSPVLFFLCR